VLDRLVAWFLFLLHAQSPRQFCWKLVVLCASATLATAALYWLFSPAGGGPSHLIYIVTFVVALPFFAIGIVVATRLLALQTQLQSLANTDQLTGLPNRRAFFAQLDKAENGLIILLDIDNFKSINDAFGHAGGDRVLARVARFLRDGLSAIGPVARIGGEEVAALVPLDRREDVLDMIEGFVAGLPVTERDLTFKITLSAGLAEITDRTDHTRALQRADEALYAAKRAGRARFKVWTQRA